jgi:hypothetical protein
MGYKAFIHVDRRLQVRQHRNWCSLHVEGTYILHRQQQLAQVMYA